MTRAGIFAAVLLFSGVAVGQPAEPLQPAQPAEPAATPEPAPINESPREPIPMEPELAPMVTAPAPAQAARVGYKGGFFIESADGLFKVSIGTRVQARFELSNEETVDAMGGEDRATATAFSIPRARLYLKGHAFSKDIKYKFQVDFGKGTASLKDFFIDYKVGTPILRIGQFKRPFSRQQIASTSKTATLERAITDKAFGAGRDIGIAVHNNYQKSPKIEWAAGVFNGTGDKASLGAEVDPVTGEVTGGFSNVPGDIQPAVVGRIGYNEGGINGYTEIDLKGGPLRFGVGASVLSAFDIDGDDESRVAAEVDGIVKVNGLSASAGLYVASAQDGEGFADQSYDAVGFHVQGGYLLDKQYHPALSYAFVKPDGESASHELTGALSILKFKHNVIWQLDFSLLGSAGLTDEVRARTQLQLYF